MLLHGLVLWDDPLQRAVAIGSAAVSLGATVLLVVRGAYRAQAVVELQAAGDDDRGVVFNVTAAGRPARAHVEVDGLPHMTASSGALPALPRLRSVTFRLPPSDAHAVKLWLHRLTADGRSEGLAGRVALDGGRSRPIDTRLLVPLRRGANIEITLSALGRGE
jgi:hypothetical protein